MSVLSARRVWRISTSAWRQAAWQLPAPTYTSDQRAWNGGVAGAASGSPASRTRVSGTAGSGRGGEMSVPWLTRPAGRQAVP